MKAAGGGAAASLGWRQPPPMRDPLRHAEPSVGRRRLLPAPTAACLPPWISDAVHITCIDMSFKKRDKTSGLQNERHFCSYGAAAASRGG